MTIRKHNDEHGHMRGQGHYSREHAKLTHPKMVHPVQSVAGKNTGGPAGALPAGGASRHKPKTGPITIGGGKTDA
jgi:hypothetical protein